MEWRPAAHASQATEALSDCARPASHDKHTGAPDVFEYFPGSHTEQVETPLLWEKEPGAHGSQLRDALAYVPATHKSHPDAAC